MAEKQRERWEAELNTRLPRATVRLTGGGYLNVIVMIVAVVGLTILANGLLGQWNWQAALQRYTEFASQSESLSWLWTALYLLAFAIGGIGTASLFEMRRRTRFREELRENYTDLIARIDALQTNIGKPTGRTQST